MSLAGHFRVLKHAWSQETKRRREGQKTYVEREFLPAALEVTETPPSPTGRLIAWTIIAAVGVALTWSIFSHVDTVAVAEGRLVPTGRLRSVEAAEAGIVRAIDVREGERVRAGQVLVALDPTFADADAQSAQTELTTASLIRARANALLSYASTGRAAFTAPPGSDALAADAERQLVAARISEYNAKRASMEQRKAAANATVRMAQSEIDRLRQTAPLIEQQYLAQKHLAERGYTAELRVMQEQERLISVRQQLVSELARHDEALAQLSSISSDLAEAKEAFRGQAARERAEAEGIVATRGDSVRKADQRQALQQLTAPVSGVVQEVSVTTLGEVAEQGKPLITIIPDGEELVVEALVLNKDVGFVRAGQQVVIKLEAYPFTRYGSLKGVLERISPDAIVDERRGLVFPTRVRLLQKQLKVEGRPALLSSGMGVSVEIVTGRRRVIEYLWSPISRSVSEAGRER